MVAIASVDGASVSILVLALVRSGCFKHGSTPGLQLAGGGGEVEKQRVGQRCLALSLTATGAWPKSAQVGTRIWNSYVFSTICDILRILDTRSRSPSAHLLIPLPVVRFRVLERKPRRPFVCARSLTEPACSRPKHEHPHPHCAQEPIANCPENKPHLS